ncbi:MAG: hypothetical protein IPJ71_10585 [Bdellovibrionales bacterium]|nr:hypothetical protein [Bdellovibrionales bacterium]
MKLGKLQNVELRDVWPKEERDFTTWMAENLDSLSEALDIGIDLIQVEQKVDESNFTIDILAEDEDGERIIIENQLEKTDHSHLGQIITYATNMDAKTVVWITKHPRQEHINAINWLNELTDKSFYLVQVEALKIDNSNPAPYFSVICRPSVETKTLGTNKKVISEVIEARRKRRSISDTIIVPARKEGFDRVFLGENSWYAIRLREERIPQLKYIAGYQVAPISAITHIAEVKEIKLYKDTGKYMVVFKGPAKEIKPIKIGSKSKVQGPAYCEYEKIATSKTVDDLLGADDYSGESAA